MDENEKEKANHRSFAAGVMVVRIQFEFNSLQSFSK